MITGTLTMGKLPQKATSFVVRYRRAVLGTTYEKLLETTAEQVEVEIPEDQPVWLVAHVRSESGSVEPAFKGPIYISPSFVGEDKPHPTDLTFPAPEIRQEGTALIIKPDVPEGINQDDYIFEVRTTRNGEGEEDGLLVGEVKAGDEIRAFAPTTAPVPAVHTIPIRGDGELGNWTNTGIDIVDPPELSRPAAGDDHDTDFSADTFVGGDGSVVLEETSPGAGVQLKAVFAGDTDTGFAGDADDEFSPFAGDQDGYFRQTVIEQPEINHGGKHTFEVEFDPEFTSPVRVDPFAGDELDPVCERFDWAADPYFPDGVEHRHDYAFGEQTPHVVIVEIRTQTTDVAVSGAWERVVPGRRYVAWRLQYRFRIFTFYLKRIIILRFKIRRRILNLKFEFITDFTYPVTSGLVEFTFPTVLPITEQLTAVVTVFDTTGEGIIPNVVLLSPSGINIELLEHDGTIPAASAAKKLHIVVAGH